MNEVDDDLPTNLTLSIIIEIFLQIIYFIVMLSFIFIFLVGLIKVTFYSSTIEDLFVTFLLGIITLFCVSVYRMFIRIESYVYEGSEIIIHVRKIYFIVMVFSITVFYIAFLMSIFEFSEETMNAMVIMGIITLFLVMIYVVFVRDDSHSGYDGSKIIFLNPNTEALKEAPLGFSWTILFFGFFVPLFRSDWKWGTIMLLFTFLSFGVTNFVFMFLYNKLYIKDLIASGFKAKDLTQDDIDLLFVDLNITIPMLGKEALLLPFKKEDVTPLDVYTLSEERNKHIEIDEYPTEENNNYIELKECPNCGAEKVVKVDNKYMCMYCNSTRYISNK